MMANEMSKYHGCLQHRNTIPHPPNWDPTTTALLMGMLQLPTHIKDKMSERLTYNKIENALMSSPNNKAAGINGIPTDLLKELRKSHKQNSKQNKPSFDIINLLRTTYNDIEQKGIMAPDIQDGWLCPLYKKKRLM